MSATVVKSGYAKGVTGVRVLSAEFCLEEGEKDESASNKPSSSLPDSEEMPPKRWEVFLFSAGVAECLHVTTPIGGRSSETCLSPGIDIKASEISTLDNSKTTCLGG